MKQKRTLLIALAAFAVLLAVYALTAKPEEDTAETPEPSTSVALINRNKSDIVKMTFKSERSEITLTQKKAPDGADQGWTVEGQESLILDKYMPDNMAATMYGLNASEKLSDKPENPAQYGLDPPTASGTAEYTDGTRSTVYLGRMTPSQEHYYMMLDGDPALYTVESYTGKRFFNTLNDLVDKSFPSVSVQDLQYVYVRERGKPEIELSYTPPQDEERTAQLEQYGMTILTMSKPLKDREIYLSNFTEKYLDASSSTTSYYITLNEVVDVNPSSLGKYGLDEPSLTVVLKDSENEMHLMIGDDYNEEYAYCKTSDRPYIYTVRKSYIEKLYGIDIFAFISRFVALEGIDNVDTLSVTGLTDRNYQIVLNKEIVTQEDGREFSNFYPTVNGVEVQESAFKKFYSSMISLSYDRSIDDFVPGSRPEVVITYRHLDDTPPVETKYYDYNANFYAVQVNNEPVEFVVNKLSVRQMFETLDDVLAGKYDS